MRASPLRLSAIALTAALVLGALGLAWHVLHFGLTDSAASERLARDVRQIVAERSAQIQSLAERVSRNGDLVEQAEASTEKLSDLFKHLQDERGRTIGFERVSITVYVPTASRGRHRVLAWSDGAAEDISQRLTGPPALFVSPGTGGLLLVFVQPIESRGRRVGVAAAETVLAPAPNLQLQTAFGPVTVEPGFFQGAGGPSPDAGRFVVNSSTGDPLLQVQYSSANLTAQRHLGYRRAAAVAALPLVVLGLLLTGRLMARRAHTRPVWLYLGWSIVIAGIVAAAGAVLGQLTGTLGAAVGVFDLFMSLAALAGAALIPASLWWRPVRRWNPWARPVRFVLEQLLGGMGVLGVLVLLGRVSQDRHTTSPISAWEWPLFPLDAGSVSHLLLQIALCWTVATSLAALTSRWRLGWRNAQTGVIAVALWLAPSIAAAARFAGDAPLPPAVWAPLAGALVTFALLATTIRRYYRHTTQAMRLMSLFGALFLPTLMLYPVAAVTADATARRLIELNYSPVLADQPRRVRAALSQAQAEIDGEMPGRLPSLIADARANPVRSQNAFSVWNSTSLSRSRLTSAVELYGPDGSLVSRFALNIPEYTYNANVQKWQGAGCTWQTYDEPRRLGAGERRVFRAERGVCDRDGTSSGGIVVQVVLDYESLPFVPNPNPYAEVLPTAVPEGAEPHLEGLQVVVYGWSLYPLSPSGQLAWPISKELSDRLYRSRDPFWKPLSAGERPFHVYFTSDRSAFYAIGYPVSSNFEHASRLAESAALTGILFVGFLLGAAIYGPFAERREAPLRALFNEIRTSFYRKLFLFFVFAAVMPVVMFALAFGAYMQTKLRADVVSEATNVVTVARRVLEELAALERPDQSPTPPTDDVMVWIGQVIHQHVNLFEGSRLRATSQRDLFESGLLPMRTPAAAYRAIVLDRLPTVVKEDQLGTLQYQVAAAPVPAYGRESVLSVPLALRQKEIEQQIADLNRGVLVGAVVVVLFAAGLGASVAGRISDPVSRLTRATRQIAAGQLDVRIVVDTADELRRLVDDFNSMAETLVSQRAALARTNQLKAWNEMARQVAHEIKNPLTPIQLAAEHLRRVHEDARKPMGPVFDHCISTILMQVRLLRQIAAEFSNFAGEPTARPTTVVVRDLIEDVVAPYRTVQNRVVFEVAEPVQPLTVVVDRTLIARALTNVIENALHAMPSGGTLYINSTPGEGTVVITLTDTGVGMDAEAVKRAFEPYFSTRTAGSGLGLANAKRNIELCGGSIVLASTPGRGTVVTVTLPVEARPASSAGA